MDEIAKLFFLILWGTQCE